MAREIAESAGAELRRVRVFVCSSGDMIAERQAALRVIEAINRAAHGAARLEPYLWEENTHAFQGALSYQGNIPLPAEFDIFLGFLFSRIGSRLKEEEYRRDIVAKLVSLSARSVSDEGATGDLLALARLSADLPPEAFPTGTTFEIINARDAAQRPGGDGLPCMWLAVNEAIPDGLTSRDRSISEPMRQRWDEVSRFVDEELNARHTPVAKYGADAPRAQQLKPGGLQEFEEMLEAWLTSTLATRFDVRLGWAKRAYVGLRPFMPEEAPIFRGRRASIGEALDRLDQLARQGECPMLLLSGPSGAGKSSFARAGLIGNLSTYRLNRRRAEGSLFVVQQVRTWRHLIVRPAEMGDDPTGNMLDRIGELLRAAGAFDSFASDLAALSFAGAEDTVPSVLAEQLRAMVQSHLAAIGEVPALFLLVDQLEDLLTTGEREVATRRLLALLRALADSPERNIWIVVAVADQWRATLGSAGLATALEGAVQFVLPLPRESELREIIEMPARRAGLVFEQGPDGKSLDQTILDDLYKLSLYSEAPLPLLEMALVQLEDRRHGDRLTFAAYREMGGVAGAIRSHARAALASWQTPDGQPMLDRLLFHLMHRDAERRIVCRLAPRQQIKANAEIWALTEHLLSDDVRLLQGHDAPDVAGAIRISHDVLLNHVEAFAKFREDEQENILLLSDARDATSRWRLAGEPRELLYHHFPTVEQLEKLLVRLGMDSDNDLAAFVAASLQDILRLMDEHNFAEVLGRALSGLLTGELGIALNELPEEQRSLILLADLEGMKYSELAEVFGVPRKIIRSRLARGREVLRQQMGVDAARRALSALAALDSFLLFSPERRVQFLPLSEDHSEKRRP